MVVCGALQIAEKRRDVKGKGEKERYTHVNAEFQRIARRVNKTSSVINAKNEEGFLNSPCYSLEVCTQMGISSPFSFAFHFSSFSAICKASSDSHFAMLHFGFSGMVLVTTSCTMLGTSIHNFSGTLSDLIP